MFWSRFYELCKSIDKTPFYVCKKLGFSNAASTHWKSGNIPNGEALIKISDFFGVSIDYLLGKTDIKKPAKIHCAEDDAKIKKILDCYKILNESGRQKAVDSITDLTTVPKYTVAPPDPKNKTNIARIAAFGGETGKKRVKPQTTAEIVKIKQTIKNNDDE